MHLSQSLAFLPSHSTSIQQSRRAALAHKLVKYCLPPILLFITLAEAKTVVEETNTLMIEVAGKMFALSKNLLSKNARYKWSTIVAIQIGANQWTDLKGQVHNLAREPSVQYFKECVTFHLLTVFPQDAAEQEKYYINVNLQKPSQVKIRHFVARVQKSNNISDVFQV